MNPSPREESGVSTVCDDGGCSSNGLCCPARRVLQYENNNAVCVRVFFEAGKKSRPAFFFDDTGMGYRTVPYETLHVSEWDGGEARCTRVRLCLDALLLRRPCPTRIAFCMPSLRLRRRLSFLISALELY